MPPAAEIRAALFDIGGVVLLSPMLAISAYEKSNNIPPGYINFAIVRSSPHGAWSQIERGEIPLDDQFYQKFTRDLSNPTVWGEYCRSKHPTITPPPMPPIDGEFLFWEMMRVSRNFDPYISPAIRKLRSLKTTDGKRKYVLGALTNDFQFPPDHEYANDNVKKELGRLFDVFISSSAVGMRKPERRIYEYAVGKLDEERRRVVGLEKGEGVEPAQVVFLDDIGMNLKGASGVGIKGIRVPLGESWRAVRELEGALGLGEGELFEEGVVERLKTEGKWREGKWTEEDVKSKL